MGRSTARTRCRQRSWAAGQGRCGGVLALPLRRSSCWQRSVATAWTAPRRLRRPTSSRSASAGSKSHS
ncbi:hypothetical protein ACFPM0_28495 [Pseudonocardia sulfidoxydans]|uniref:hypothetical protein n=1 Tax=Pseudonocardia sulfidoxydans TaxID=54011 RepID=UPI0036182FE2